MRILGRLPDGEWRHGESNAYLWTLVAFKLRAMEAAAGEYREASEERYAARVERDWQWHDNPSGVTDDMNDRVAAAELRYASKLADLLALLPSDEPKGRP